MGFITVNGRILDLAEYRKDVSALRFEIAYEISECLAKYGFQNIRKHFQRYDGLDLVFIDNRNGLEMRIELKRKK